MWKQKVTTPKISRTVLLASSVLFTSIFLQSFHLDFYCLTSDECFSIYHAQMLPEITYRHLSTGNNPPLHEWILHYWMRCFGDSAFAVRFLSVLFSSFTAVGIFLLGIKLNLTFSKADAPNYRLAITAVLIFLASNYTTFLAHEARAYNLFMFLSVWSTLQFIRAMRSSRPIDFAIWGLIGGLICLSHFFGFWILLAQGTWILYQRWKFNNTKNSKSPEQDFIAISTSKFWRHVLVGLAGFTISFGWYIPNFWHRFVDSASQGTWVNPAPWNAPYLTLWKYFNTPAATVIACILLLSVGIAIIRKKSIIISSKIEISSSTAGLLAWSFAFPFFTMWLLSVNMPWSLPMFNERYTCFTLPFIALSTATGIYSTPLLHKNKFTKQLAILPLVLILLGKSIAPSNHANAKETLMATKTAIQKTTPIILEPYHAGFQVLYYANRNDFRQYHPTDIYPHLAQQLCKSNIWILKTKNSLDSLGFSRLNQLAYLHFGTEKSKHTRKIESQLNALKNRRITISSNQLQINNNGILNAPAEPTESEFWVIDKK